MSGGGSSTVIKVSVADMDSQNTVLYDLDIDKGLNKNITKICRIFEKPVAKEHLYGLKLYSNNNGEYINKHLSEDNFNEVKDGYMLKLGFSIRYYNDTIRDSMKCKENGDQVCGQLLDNLWSDDEFIKYIAKHDTHKVLLDYFTQLKDDSEKQEDSVPYLKTLGHLFQKNFFTELSSAFTDKLLGFIDNPDTCNDVLIYTLSIIHKILSNRDNKFNEFKEKIVSSLPFEKLTPYLWHEERPDLQYGALLAINTIIRVCKSPTKDELIKEISAKKIKQIIFEHIIESSKKDDRIGQELCVYQTYLLSKLSEELTRLYDATDVAETFKVTTNNIELDFSCTEFNDLASEELSKILGEINLVPKSELRISFASMGSFDTVLSDVSNFRLSTVLNGDGQDFYINHLTHQALWHYKNLYGSHYLQSYIEEETFEPGILKTSEVIMQILVNILHIGQEPVKNCSLYQPTIFSNSVNIFIYELFSRAMYLLTKTRREMKASSIDDYYKVIKVLEKQLVMVLEQNPIDFKSMSEKIQNISYRSVESAWQKEKDAQMKTIFEKNPCILQLKEQYKRANETCVFENRINFMCAGGLFKKILEKKQHSFVFMRLHKNRRHLHISDYDVSKNQQSNTAVKLIHDISHVTSGRDCLHAKTAPMKEVDLSLTIIIDNKETFNLVAADKKVLAYWIDGLNLLTEKPHRSDLYYQELDKLVHMDLSLHLIELQEAKIPNKPPVIPAPPIEKPKIPPRPLKLIIKS